MPWANSDKQKAHLAQLCEQNKGRKRPMHSLWMREHYHEIMNEESMKKVKEKLRGRVFSALHCNNISIAKKGKCLGEDNPFHGHHHTKDTKSCLSMKSKMMFSDPQRRHHLSQTRKGSTMLIDTKLKISQASKGRKLTEEHKQRIGESNRKRWQDPIFREIAIAKYKPGWIRHITDHLERRPTKLEKRVIDLITRYELPYRYVGDGSFWIGGLNPDFISTGKKRIAVEVFGTYWHTPGPGKKLPETSIEECRVDMFRKFGWTCLIIWESELSENHIKYVLEHAQREEVLR